MKKSIYLGQAIPDLSQIIMYEFHYDYIKLKHDMNLWLCYMDTDSLVYDIKMYDSDEDVASNITARFNMSNYSPSLVPHRQKQEDHWPYEG